MEGLRVKRTQNSGFLHNMVHLTTLSVSHLVRPCYGAPSLFAKFRRNVVPSKRRKTSKSWKMKASHSSAKSGNDSFVPQRHTPEGRNNKSHSCEHLKTHNDRWRNSNKPSWRDLKHWLDILTPVQCIFIICSSTNTCTKPIYYINFLLHNCTYVILRHVSTSVRHHEGSHLFLAKITCMASVVIDYCIYHIHVFYVFYLSNNFMYFTCLTIYHNRRHTSNFSQEQMSSLMMTHWRRNMSQYNVSTIV